MKVTLDIDSNAVGGSIAEMLTSLSQEDRRAVCCKVMEAWLRDPGDIERKAHEQDVIANMRAASYSDRDLSDDKIRDGWSFKDRMNGFRTTREKMVATIETEIEKHYAEAVAEYVRADPAVAKMKTAAIANVRKSFPKMVSAAIVAWVASGLGGATHNGNEGRSSKSIVDMLVSAVAKAGGE